MTLSVGSKPNLSQLPPLKGSYLSPRYDLPDLRGRQSSQRHGVFETQRGRFNANCYPAIATVGDVQLMQSLLALFNGDMPHILFATAVLRILSLCDPPPGRRPYPPAWKPTGWKRGRSLNGSPC